MSGRFRYVGWDVDPGSGRLSLRYELNGHAFEERITVGADRPWGPAAEEAARLVFLLAGVSYYKAGAPPVVDLGDTPVRDGDAEMVRAFYVEGLAEFAFRNGLDLTGLRVEGGYPMTSPPAPGPSGTASAGRPLVPFGGGIDSIVTVEEIRARRADVTLFVLSREGDRFPAIEDAAAVTGLPVARAERLLDPAILESRARGWLNGHVPVTGILSAVAVLVAVLGGDDAVVMSNEWSASIGNVRLPDGRSVNHQWSKSLDFESLLRDHLARSLRDPPAYFSLLRPWSELWVARRFAALERYHGVFRSCNRAFALDPTARLDHWCGRCDKCCFIDLVLAPWMPADRLAAVFAGAEPLDDPSLLPQFRTLVGLSDDDKPFECVGDVGECRVAAVSAASRPDRAASPVLAALAAELAPELAAGGTTPAEPDTLLAPLGPSFVPDRYAPQDRVA